MTFMMLYSLISTNFDLFCLNASNCVVMTLAIYCEVLYSGNKMSLYDTVKNTDNAHKTLLSHTEDYAIYIAQTVHILFSSFKLRLRLGTTKSFACNVLCYCNYCAE